LRGRKRELAMFGEALARAKVGQASTVVFVGEPGIGKSRLANEAAAVAAGQGFRALWGRAWEAGGAPAYWPWRQLCEGLEREGPIAQLWGRRGESTTDPDQARFELFDAVTRVLAHKASDAPLVCILDDLHAADIPSLELLAFATRHMRTGSLVWLLTWRDAEGARNPVREPLARIAREAAVAPLSALTDVDANELIDDVCSDADIELRERLVRATGGNPLFLIETLAAVATGHVRTSELERLPLAQGIATIVADRLAPLAADVRELAAAASVVGRDVSLARWAVAAEREPDDIRRGAAVLVETGLLLALGHDRWRFGHDLVREAIYRDAPVSIHGRLARCLDTQVAAGDLSVIGERAHHALYAGAETRTVLDWTIEAADHARNQCAYEEALALIDATTVRLGAAAQRDGALQCARGRALLDLGQTEKASEAFTAAIALARAAGDPTIAALAALGYGARYVFGDHLHDLIAMIDHAMAALPEGETELYARLLARKAAALTPAPEPEPVLDMAREANALVREASDVVRLEVAVAVGSAFLDFASWHEMVEVNATVVNLARARGDRALELRGLTRQACEAIANGQVTRADSVIAQHGALARSLVQPRFRWITPLLRSMRAMMVGEFAICDAAIAEATAFAGHEPNVARTCAVHRMWMLVHADRIVELREHEPVLLATIRTMTPTMSAVIRAVARLRSGDLDGARDALADKEPAWSHGRGLTTLSTAAEVVAEIGPEADQRLLYELLVPYRDAFAIWGPFGLICGPPTAAMLGNLASAFGDHARAVEHFETAVAMATAAGATVGRAWTNYWFARALVRTGDARAAGVLDDAIRDATRGNVPGLVERCRRVTVARDAAPAPVPVAALQWSLAESAGSWQMAVGDRKFLVPNLRGMAMLQRLVSAPHVEVHSLELVSGSAPEADAGDSGEVLDAQARATYRKRLARLDDELEEAEARGDAKRAERAAAERDMLMKELSRAVGIGGKTRRAGAASERARIAVQRRLREAIKKIGELDAELGAHLDKAIRTGNFCAYRP
jgi:tetratricopeptide (TPR) repeat protein